ncbi:MAG TPA: long-chain-fatty-acid--CoA ligase [Syntrophales bacterium]|nr:long-chain-fatty-acid--CoA ligase [Syntrophales bacterium]HOL59676.1 long-chain-fatty-acid--CoA ligase [Syntrophales bacterium]HPO35822.1 long-chain-fatty-acid--CoA ligase [Syntrophales bacterium]
MNLAQLGEERVKQVGKRVTLIYEDREMTNFEILAQAKRLASALHRLGVEKGDRVIVQSPNCPEVLQSFGAIWRLGAVIVPINYLVGEEETAYIYRDSGAKVVISRQDFLPKINSALASAPDVKHVILIDGKAGPNTLAFRDLVNESPEMNDCEDTQEDDNAAIIYTAGTTGRPKGVVHTHGSLYHNAYMQHETVKNDIPDGLTAIGVLPLCHSYGIATMNNSLFRTTKTVLMGHFDLEKIFSSIERYKANLLSGVPTMYVYMLLYPDPKKYDLSSMMFWFSGSAPLSLETWKKFKEVFGFEIIEGWGLTEAGANNAVNPIRGLKKVGSIGKPMVGTQMGIMDDEGRMLAPNERGEIVIRGPQIMKEYWQKPEETKEAIRNGWLHTGDVGYVDEDGYFWITDRKKDLIIKGGENISPRMIEEVLYMHPKVSEAAVIGKPDPVYGEDIKAFVVLMPGETATPEEIIEFCRTKLTSFYVPKEVVFLSAMPKSLVGKILKQELRKM